MEERRSLYYPDKKIVLNEIVVKDHLLFSLDKHEHERCQIQETNFIHIDKHRKMKEAIVEGPNGPQAVVLSVEDDVHVDEEIRKNETIAHNASFILLYDIYTIVNNKGLHGKVKSSDVQSDTEIVNVGEHRNVKEDIEGPHGSKAVVLTVEDDVHIDEILRKNEKVGKGLHGNAEAVKID
ncbi:hypothetical protein ACFX11_002495 [Malus domestica]